MGRLKMKKKEHEVVEKEQRATRNILPLCNRQSKLLRFINDEIILLQKEYVVDLAESFALRYNFVGYRNSHCQKNERIKPGYELPNLKQSLTQVDIY